MAGGSLGSLTIDLAANITRFERALNRAENQAQKRSTAIKRTFTRLAGGIGVALGGIQIGRLVDDSLKFGKTLEDTRQKLGLTAETLQEFRFAAEQTGVPVNALDVGIQRFTRRMGEAAEGTGVLYNVMQDLGIELRTADGTMRSTEDVLNDYADAIQNADSSQRQLLLAFKAFDTEGAALVNTLRRGSDGLADLRQQARDTGGVMSGVLTESAKQIADRWSTLNDTIGNKFKIATVTAIDAALNLFGIFNNLGDVQGALIEKQDLLTEAQIRYDNATGRNRKAAANRVEVLKQEIAELEKLQETLIAARAARDIAVSGGDGAGTGTGEETKKNTFTGMTQEEMQADFDNAVAMGAQFRDIFAEQNAARLKSERQINDLITSHRRSTVQNAIGFLQVLGQRSKTAALAALALQKGLAIAETIVNTQAAAMRAMAELGPIAGPPAAASIKAAGAASVALIGATGLLQAGGIGGGSGIATPSGTPTDPISTSDTNLFTGSDDGQSGTTGTITINVNGVVTEEIMQDLVIPAIQDATNDKDVILFRSDSRQAIELEA